MFLILAAVFEKNTVELLDMVFRHGDGLETLESQLESAYPATSCSAARK